jgi:hypothetical protein
MFFFKTHHKAVILSEALRRSIANRGLNGAESKDPGDACSQMLSGAFRPHLLLSEDMKDGFIWHGVTVANPFARSKHLLLKALLSQHP